MCVNFFLKDFSRTTVPRILNFFIKTSGMTSCIVYERISQIWLISPFICPFFFLSNKLFHHISSASISSRVFKFCFHYEDDQVKYCKQNQGAEIYFLSLSTFPFFYLSLQCDDWKFSSKISQELLVLGI